MSVTPTCEDWVVLIAERTFLGLPADAWSAVGIWATIGVYLALAVFAWRQLGETRTLRVQQARPYVIANIQGRSVLIYLVFENIGVTQATNVRISFENRLLASNNNQLSWQDSTAFAKGIPTVAPGFKLRFFFDSFPVRMEQNLPMSISGRISYEDTLGKKYDEPFLIDLTVYGEALQAEKDLSDLVAEVKQTRQEMKKWTDGTNGVLVKVTDRDRANIRSERPYHFMKARRSLKEHGPRAAARYYLELWRRRGGWYSR
jgi:hypothetical protein